ncbi:helix-turn-helix transcriptional regulator [Selenomonas sp. AE3005]|uniref:helix-turn-helix transcriptional regulator n=1 Tax=Selenomonas sp. AE3005 TaxID=1485543 RepID=UPI0004873652|nr:helix-turn-helix transcriptional regulator [Selenomonas sp. AE3005]
MTPSEKIKICLDMKNLKRKDLAEASGMSPSSVSDFLNGKTTKLDITKAQSIANTLGCTLNYLVGDDTMHMELGAALKSERVERGETTDVVSLNTKIPEALILKYESGDEEVSEFLLGKLCEHYDLSIVEFLQKYDLYDEYIPPQFNGDAEEYETFRRAEREDALKSSAGYPELKDIINKGMYVVNGYPARRTYRNHLQSTIEMIYHFLDRSVSFPPRDEADAKEAFEELVTIYKRYGTSKDIEVLNQMIEGFPSSMSYEEKFEAVMEPYHKAIIDNEHFE